MKLFNLLQTQYNNFMSAVSSNISEMLSTKSTRYGNATVFGQLINVLGAVVQNMMLYIEDSLVEQNKYTAQRKKSIYGLAALSGYEPSYGKASGVQLSLVYTPTAVNSLNVLINNRERLTCTQNGLNYAIILPQEAIVINLARDNSTRYLYAVQGRFESQAFVCQGGGKYYTQNFRFNGNLDEDYIEVKVNNEVWEHAASFYDMKPDGKQYVTKVNYVSGIDLVFGNDRYGRSLSDGDVVELTYLLHDGEAGNLNTDLETWFTFDNALNDISGNSVDGNSMFNVTFASKDAVTSGTNSEQIEQVRQMIGLNSRSLVLASPENYKNFLNKFSFVGYNRTWSEKGSLVVNSLVMRNYAQNLASGLDYFNLKKEDFLLTEAQKLSIQNCIVSSGNQLAGASYNIFDPEICGYALYVYIKLKKTTADKEYIEAQVRTLIGEYFSDIQSDTYIAKSDITQLIMDNVSGIEGVNIYFLSEKNEMAIIHGEYEDVQYTFDPSRGVYNKKITTVKLYDGQNPNLGLDAHGNIYLENDEQYPVLIGGWEFLNSAGDLVFVNDPLVIVFEK